MTAAVLDLSVAAAKKVRAKEMCFLDVHRENMAKKSLEAGFFCELIHYK